MNACLPKLFIGGTVSVCMKGKSHMSTPEWSTSNNMLNAKFDINSNDVATMSTPTFAIRCPTRIHLILCKHPLDH